MTKNAFEEHLLREQVLSADALSRAHAEATGRGAPLIEVARDLGLATETSLYQSLATFCETAFTRAEGLEVARELTESVPARYATHYGFVPLAEQGSTLKIATCDPLNTQLMDDIQQALKRPIEPLVMTPGDIDKAITALYGVGADTVERMISAGAGGTDLHVENTAVGANLTGDGADASIVGFVNELITNAIASDATDIHIEPFEDELQLRFRVDGILHPVQTPPGVRGFHAAIVSRIKVMANLNIAEKRLPQDGKIAASVGESRYDLRVSVLPTPYGESIDIRILSRASMFLSLGDLGFLEDDTARFGEFIARPHGIVLLTGPTGSGKTTTLYAALSKLNRADRKIITIEDPIEYQLKGITQMQVQPQIGFDFGAGLRSMLRHDPDVMMVGEIRDYETAEMAIRASLTGHLVFSTLHTNDAPGAVTRLIDMGVEPFLVASTLIGVVAQRLVRRICPECAEPVDIDARTRSAMGIANGEYREGRGCESCRRTGYRGRTAVCEVMPFSNAIKELTLQSASANEIRNAARREGMRSLRESGALRVSSGQSTVAEIVRITSNNDSIAGADAPVG